MGKMTTRRKLAIATWSAPQEGNIYGKLTVDVTNALRYIDDRREASGEKVTITHLVGKAVANALAEAPDLNGRIVFGSFVPHETVDVTFLVVLDGGSDLAKVKVERADEKSVIEITKELGARAGNLRAGKDQEFEKSKGMLRSLPTWLLRPILRLVGFLTGALGVQVPALGLERFPFGSCILTSVGMFGLDEGYVPPTPFARVPVYVLLGAIRDHAVVIDNEIVIRKQITLTATLDHRFVDGYQAGVLAKTLRSVLENPACLEETS
jgi:pyruvate/2-oxoglutarate dehydrogenase complex dihydrolipoamide acyltransferase (E2) component